MGPCEGLLQVQTLPGNRTQTQFEGTGGTTRYTIRYIIIHKWMEANEMLNTTSDIKGIIVYQRLFSVKSVSI